MTTSRSDRPYGAFPAPGSVAPPPAPSAPPPVVPLRQRVWRRVAAPLAVLLMLCLTVVALDEARSGAERTVGAIQTRATPSPTPPLAAAVYAQIAPSVVEITARTVTGDPSSGAGVVVDDQGDILTSLHIVKGATSIDVRFSDGTSSPAQIVSSLPDRDVAVLRPDATPTRLRPATLGDPSRLLVGSPAFVIGHPFGLTGSLSAGVVSGLDRSLSAPGRAKPLTGLIQFDAAVNPGSSGGPLVDANGEVVGIVTGLVNPSGEKVFSGVGFAVTIDQAAGALGAPID